MAQPAILSIRDAFVSFGKKTVFEGLTAHIHTRDRISLVGRNGVGKTTLIQLITGQRELDAGERWIEPATSIGCLDQDSPYVPEHRVFEHIFYGLPPEKQNSDYHFMVEQLFEPFELRPDDIMADLSGGQLRRASLARALVEEPDILILDEPTNHLDLAGIEWLENFLSSYRGALLCVSHDKRFLKVISNRIFWLDRGRVRVCPQGFAHFEEWSQNLLEQEARELAKREKIMAQEQDWANRGVPARRKRNVKRLELLRIEREALRKDKYLYHQTTKRIDLPPLPASQSSRVVGEFYRVSKSFGEGQNEKKILDQFSLRIMRGDRIGLLGKNGSGKTSFIKLLMGEIKPDKGTIKMAHTLEISYFDQRRSGLNPSHSLKRTLCPNGGDYVDVMGKSRHVCGYLKDFLFDPKDYETKVGTLSGGQKNRLMLAKVLANPGNFLILDEPTNDLDMDTLEMLEDIIARYEGTLLIVGHDRDFLDQTVTQILAFEGNADVEGYIGGYSDYLEARNAANAPARPAPVATSKTPPVEATPPKAALATRPVKLTFKQQQARQHLPQKIESLTQSMKALEARLADTAFYTADPDGFFAATTEYATLRDALEDAESQWLELEMLLEQS